MSFSSFPPADPLLQGLAILQHKASNITMADIQRTARQAMTITLSILVFALGVGIVLAKRSHQLLKALIILLRIGADMLEHMDDWIEQLILDNQPIPQPAPTAPAVYHHPLAQLAEDLMSNTASELRSITGAKRKRSKQTMVNDFLAMSA